MIDGRYLDSSRDLFSSDRYAWNILAVINLRGYFIFVFIFKKAGSFIFHILRYLS